VRVSPPTSGDNYDLPGAWVGGSMDLRPDAETMSLDGRSGGEFLPDVDRAAVLYLALCPDLLLSLQPGLRDGAPTRAQRAGRHSGRVFLVRAGRGRRRRMGRGLLGPDQPAGLGRLRVRAAWARLTALPARTVGPNEDAVYQWVTLIARAYLGTPTVTAYEATLLQPRRRESRVDFLALGDVDDLPVAAADTAQHALHLARSLALNSTNETLFLATCSAAKFSPFLAKCGLP